MASVIDICNRALDMVGGQRIIALTDGSAEANICAANYAEARDALLRAHAWNFATRRLKLARADAAPDYGFLYAYPLPADWLRTLEVHDNEGGRGAVAYRLEGGYLLADCDEIWLSYITRVTDPNRMDAGFRHALSAHLAAAIGFALTNSQPLAERMEQKALRLTAMARGVDAQEDGPRALPASSWVTER